MSKAAKQIAFILILVILILLGVTGYILTEKKKADDENIRLKQQLTETEKRANDYFAQNKTLNDKVRGYETENESLQGKVSQANEEVTRVRDELAEIADEKDKWQRRVDEIVQDRDKLMNRVKELVEQSADQKEEIAEKLKMKVIDNEHIEKYRAGVASAFPTLYGGKILGVTQIKSVHHGDRNSQYVLNFN